MIGPVWIGDVVKSELAGDGPGGAVIVGDSKWPIVPLIGARVEVRIIYMSPYWSLVEDDV